VIRDEFKVIAVDKKLKYRDKFLLEIRGRMPQARDYMKPYHDKLHRDLVFQVDEWVWLRLHHHLATGITDSSKSKVPFPRFYDPYQVVEKVGTVAYRLRLPASRGGATLRVVGAQAPTIENPI
jgi:hypothetical protein